MPLALQRKLLYQRLLHRATRLPHLKKGCFNLSAAIQQIIHFAVRQEQHYHRFFEERLTAEDHSNLMAIMKRFGIQLHKTVDKDGALLLCIDCVIAKDSTFLFQRFSEKTLAKSLFLLLLCILMDSEPLGIKVVLYRLQEAHESLEALATEEGGDDIDALVGSIPPCVEDLLSCIPPRIMGIFSVIEQNSPSWGMGAVAHDSARAHALRDFHKSVFFNGIKIEVMDPIALERSIGTLKNLPNDSVVAACKCLGGEYHFRYRTLPDFLHRIGPKTVGYVLWRN